MPFRHGTIFYRTYMHSILHLVHPEPPLPVHPPPRELVLCSCTHRARVQW